MADRIAFIVGGLLGNLLGAAWFWESTMNQQRRMSLMMEYEESGVDVPARLLHVHEHSTKENTTYYVYYSYSYRNLHATTTTSTTLLKTEPFIEEEDDDTAETTSDIEEKKNGRQKDPECQMVSSCLPDDHDDDGYYEKMYSPECRPNLAPFFTVRVLPGYPKSGIPKMMIRENLKPIAGFSTLGAIVIFMLGSMSVWLGLWGHSALDDDDDNNKSNTLDDDDGATAMSFALVIVFCLVLCGPATRSCVRPWFDSWKENLLQRTTPCPAQAPRQPGSAASSSSLGQQQKRQQHIPPEPPRPNLSYDPHRRFLPATAAATRSSTVDANNLASSWSSSKMALTSTKTSDGGPKTGRTSYGSIV